MSKTIIYILLFILTLWQGILLVPGFTRYNNHPDELGSRFKKEAIWLDWKPADFKYPTTHIYTLQIVYATLHSTGLVSQYDVQTLNYIGRVLSGIMAVGCSFLAWSIFLQAGYRRWQALAAFVIVSSYPLLQNLGRFNTTDVPNLFWCLLSIYYALWAINSRNLQSYALAGTVCGFAAGVKFLAVLLFPGIAIAFTMHLYRLYPATAIVKYLTVWGTCILVGFIISTPYSVIQFSRFIEAVKYLHRVVPAFTGYNTDIGAVAIPKMLYMALNPFVCTAVAFGYIVCMIKIRHPLECMLFISPLITYLFMYSNHFYPWRFLLPMVILLLLTGIIGMGALLKHISGQRPAQGVVVSLFIIGILLQYRESLAVTYNFLHESRYESALWLRSHVKPGKTISFPTYNSRYFPAAFLQPALTFDAAKTESADGQLLPLDIQYALTSSFWTSKQRQDPTYAFNYYIRNHWTMVKEFGPQSFFGIIPTATELVCPVIKIYERPFDKS